MLRNREKWQSATVGLLLSLYVAFLFRHWSDPNSDLELFFLPWMASLRDSGLLETLAQKIPNYTAPYVSYLYVFTRLFPDFELMDLAKASGAFLLVAYAFCGALAFKSVCDGSVRFGVVLIWMVLSPTAGLNAVVWTQADTLIAASLFLSFACLQREHFTASIILFAFALSSKLTSIFFAPYLLFILFQRRAYFQILIFIPLIAITYYVANLPYLFAGVSAAETLAIYKEQSQYFAEYSMNAPNPWHVAQRLLQLPDPESALGSVIIFVGIGVAAILGLIIVTAGGNLKTKLSRQKELALLLFVLIIFPYILPKMHDRYFFIADSFSWLAAAYCSRFLPVALLMQVASWMASAPFLPAVRLYVVKDAFGPHLGAVLIGLALLILLSILIRPDKPVL